MGEFQPRKSGGNMAYDSKSIANYFLTLANSHGEPLSPMKLQKLIYYAHGWYAGYTGQPLINESIEAWQYGPVIPSIYHEFKPFGSGIISCKARRFDGYAFSDVEEPSDISLRQFLDNIWRSYGQFTATKLSEMTHAIDSPWHQTWTTSNGMRSVDIPFETIASHFKKTIEIASTKAAA